MPSSPRAKRVSTSVLQTEPIPSLSIQLAARVIAFEPILAEAKRLQELFFTGTKFVTVHEVALSDCHGEVTLRMPRDFS